MSKPLHKDPSFWIVVVTLVGAANLAQIYFGVPWFQEKLRAARPAPRAPDAPVQAAQRGDVIFQQPGLDYSKKSYSWQTPSFTPDVLERTPPQVTLIPTEYTNNGWGTMRANGVIGIRMPASYVVQSAYSWPSSTRIIFQDAAPPGQFDFIANLTNGPLEALQAEIRKKWGIIAAPATFQTNALVLTLDHTNAPGLQAVSRPAQTQFEPGFYVNPYTQIGSVAIYLEAVLRRPVINQSGLIGHFAVRFPFVQSPPGRSETLEQAKKNLLEHLGLELTETNAPVEMLVVKKAN